MPYPGSTNRVAVAALLFALLSIGTGVSAIIAASPWLLVPYALFAVLALAGSVFAWTRAVRDRSRALDRVWAGAAIFLIFTFYYGAMNFCAIARADERTGRSYAALQLKSLGACMHHDYAKYGRFPPAAICDKNGKPLLSWRVALLPILGQRALHDRFKLDEPWDSPHNHALLAEMPPVYAAPHRPDAPPGTTVYQGFVGPGTPFDPVGVLRLPPDDFPGGPRELLLIVEAAEPVPWTQPIDLVYAADQPLPRLGSAVKYFDTPAMFVPRPTRGMVAVDAGGSVRWFDLDTIDDATLRGAIAQEDE